MNSKIEHGAGEQDHTSGGAGSVPSSEAGNSASSSLGVDAWRQIADLGRAKPSPQLEEARSKTLGRLGRFEMVERVGGGSFGDVYRAFDLGPLQRWVAVKVLKHELAINPFERGRFLTEGRTAAGLQHEHIVAVHEIGAPDEQAVPESKSQSSSFQRPHIVFEFVEGMTLADWLKLEPASKERLVTEWLHPSAGDLPVPVGGDSVNRDVAGGSPRPSQTAQGAPFASVRPRILRHAILRLAEVAEAIDYAHRQGVVHRDLKPGNILVDAKGRWRVTDFGLASDPFASGTPYYCSPEQAARKGGAIGPATDIYGLGVILYEILTGFRPFVGTAEEVLKQHQTAIPQPPTRRASGVPIDLELVCLRALEKDPARRFATAAEFAADLRRWLTFHPLSVRGFAPLYEARLWLRRNWQAAMGVAAVLTAVTTGLVTTLTWYREADWQFQRATAVATANEQLAHSLQDANGKIRLQLVQSHQQRGRWRMALEVLGAGEEDPSIDDRLEMARCRVALDEISEARKLLEPLMEEPLAEHQRATAELLLGDLELGINNEKALKLIRSARDRGLESAVDEKYADALLAPTVNELLEGLTEVLVLAPAHQRANAVSTLTLFVSGRSAEAQGRLLKAQAFYPDDPTLMLVQLLLLQDPKSIQSVELKERIRAVHGARVLADFESISEILSFGRELLGSTAVMDGGNNLKQLVGLRLVPAMQRILLRKPRTSGTRTLIPPQLSEAVMPVVQPVLRNFVFGAMPAAEVERAVERSLESHSDGGLHLLAGIAILRGISFELFPSPGPEQIRNLRRCIEQFHLAARTPCILPVRRIALSLAIVCHAADPERSDDEEQEALDDLKSLESEFRLQFFLRDPNGHFSDAASAWMVASDVSDESLMRRVLNAWRECSPSDPVYLIAEGKTARLRGDHLRAVAALRQLLKSPPDPQLGIAGEGWKADLIDSLRQLASEGITFPETAQFEAAK